MSDVVGEYHRMRQAFEQPTLRLLHQRHAVLLLSVFQSVFGRDNRPVPASRLHAMVDHHLAALREDGVENLPTGTGRELCQRWMRSRWLNRANSPDGEGEVYTLTAYAQEAVEQAREIARDDVTLTGHSVANLYTMFHRANAEVNPDRTTRVTMLNAEIDRLRSERDRLVDGGEIAEVGEDDLREVFAELLPLVARMSSDFVRVEDAFARIRNDIYTSFRAESRPAGEVVDDYLRRIDELTTQTPEGRAFEGAFPLLRDETMLQRLREDIGALLDHPLADGAISAADRRDLRSTVALVRERLDRVLTQRSRATATLRDLIQARDVTRDRELEQTLRNLDAALADWYAETGPRTHVGVRLLPERAKVGYLPERFHDPADDRPLAPLVRADVAEAPAETWADLRAWGGPSMEDLAAALEQAAASASGAGTLGELFTALPDHLRRPVEVFGLIHLAARADLPDAEGTEEVVTEHPDGSLQTLRIPRIRTRPVDPVQPEERES